MRASSRKSDAAISMINPSPSRCNVPYHPVCLYVGGYMGRGWSRSSHDMPSAWETYFGGVPFSFGQVAPLLSSQLTGVLTPCCP